MVELDPDLASAIAIRLCGPDKKKGTGDTGCCPGDEPISKKKNIGPCGGTGVVPEPGTWVMFASGLAVIYWQARRKLNHA